VKAFNFGLSDKQETVPLSGNNGNWGGAYIGEHMKISDVQMGRLDDLKILPDFIKIDVEGYELKVLQGAEQTIKQCHPTMVMEINRTALNRQNCRPEFIYDWLEKHGYSFKIMQENCCFESPMFDIVCSYNRKSPEVPEKVKGNLTRCVPASGESLIDTEQAVTFLRNLAEQGSKERWTVMMALYKAGLTPRKDNKPKKKKKHVTTTTTTPVPENKTTQAKAAGKGTAVAKS
jgi:hypothetical protein